MTARHHIWHRCPAHPWIPLIVIHNCPCEYSSKLQLSIRFTPSRCLDVRQDWYPMYYPEGMKARVSPVQSIEPHRILTPTRDSNQEPPGPQSRVVTTILLLHTWWWCDWVRYEQSIMKETSDDSQFPEQSSVFGSDDQALNFIARICDIPRILQQYPLILVNLAN